MARTISKTFLDQGAYLRAMDVRPTASEGEKLWAVQTLSGQWGFQHLPDSVRTNPGDFLPKLQEAIRVRSLRPVMTEDAEETENLWNAANQGTQEAWDELAKRSREADTLKQRWKDDEETPLRGEELEQAAALLNESDRETYLRQGRELEALVSESEKAYQESHGGLWSALLGGMENASTGMPPPPPGQIIQKQKEFAPLNAEARKRLAAARHVERVRQKNAFSMLAAIQGELGEEAKGIIDRAVANGYKLTDGDAERFALPEERGGIPEEQKRLAASFLRYCKPVEGSHWWSAFGKRFSDSAGQVTWSGVEELGDLFSGIAHGFDSDNYRDRVQKRAWTRTINARNFADLGWLGNSFAEAGTIMGYWTPQLVGMAAGYGMGALGGAMARGGGAVARVGAAMARGAGAVARWTPEAMYFADYREQFLTRVAMDGGDVTDPAFQVCATVGGIASAYVEHLQWGMAMGKIGLAEVQAQAYSRLTHRLLGKLGVKVGTDFGGMGAGRALGIVLAERLAVVGTEGLEEALQQAIEEVVVDAGDGKTVRLADIAETSAETFVQTLGPMVWTMFNPVALGGRAKSAATMHNLDQGAIERMMSAGERLKSLAEHGKLTDGREDLGALNQLMFAVTRAPNGAAALNALRSRGFTTPQAEAMVGTFEAIRREAIERGQLDVLGTNVLPTGEELERTGWVRNEDGSFSRDVEAEDGKRRRQTIVVENVASRAVDTTNDAEAASLLNTMRQRAGWIVALDGQRKTYGEKLAAMGIDLARSNAELLADPGARAAMAAEVATDAEMDYRIGGDTRFRETRQAQDQNGNAVEEDVFDITLTERSTRETIFHEVAHAVAKTLRNMGLTEKEIDAIQNWRSGQDGRAPNAADMALPEYTVEGKAGASELWDEERVGDEMGAALAGADDAAKGRVARAMNQIGDIVRRVLGLQKERKAMHDAVAAMEEVVRSGHWGNIDELTEVQKRLLTEARQRRAEARERQQAQQPEAKPAENAVIAPTPPEEEGASSEERWTKPDMGKSTLDRITEAFCFNKPILQTDMAQLSASGQLSEADIYETGYRWSPLLRCWTVRPECRNQPFTSNGPYMGLDGEWKGGEARAMVAATRHSLEALEDIANGKEFGILHNATYGEIHYPLGKFGRIKKNGKTDGGLGLLHIVSERMRKDGATVEEALETALRVGIAAEIGEETASIENTRWLDFEGTRAIIALTDNGNPIITGYEIRADETPAAFPSSEALQRRPLMREADIVAALKESLALKLQDVNSENRRRYSATTRLPAPEALDEFMEKRGFRVAYHGTTGRWRKAKFGDAGHGIEAFYLSAERGPAESYAALRSLDTDETEKPKVRKFYVREGNVKRVEEEHNGKEAFGEMLRKAKAEGYSAVFVSGALDDQRLRIAKDGGIVFPEEEFDDAAPADIWVVLDPKALLTEAEARRQFAAANRLPSPEFAMDGTIADALPAHLREDARAIIAERANTPAWMVEPDGTPTELNERDWLRREAEKRHEAGRRFAISGLYTGSAADYDKPSLHYIGTGEGSQVYGWGLYSSAVREVADYYANEVKRDAIRKWEREHDWFDNPYENETPEFYAWKYLCRTYASKNLAIKELTSDFNRNRSPSPKTQELFEATIEAIRASTMMPPTYNGYIYEQTFFADRATPEETDRHLLKWYEPVSEEQMGWVKDELRTEGQSETTDGWELGQADGWMLYKMLEDKFGSAKAASEFLARAGIDGIKYPVDSYGKTVKDGDEAGWNYVSFRDDNLRVDHKWVNGEQRYAVSGRGAVPTAEARAEAQRQYDAVVARYTNSDGTKKPGWMKAPNGNDTHLTEQQWVQVQTPNFRANYFGFYHLPNHQFNVVLAEAVPFRNANEGVEWATRNGIVGLMDASETNGKGEINISASSVSEMLNLAQMNKSVSRDAHYAALGRIRDIIRESELADRHPHWAKGPDGKRRAENGIIPGVTIDVLYGAMRFGTDTYRVKTTLRRYSDPNTKTKAYAYEVSEIEVLAGKPENADTSGTSSTSIPGSSLLQGVLNHKGNSVLDDFSKVVDENGEPLVVYHDTNSTRWINRETGEDWDTLPPERRDEWDNRDDWDDHWKEEDFWTFDNRNFRTSAEFPAHFFTPEADPYHEYGKRRIAAFLNLRNPVENPDIPHRGETDTAGLDEMNRLKQQGVDGFIRRYDGKINEFGVFDPAAIKSATDNAGTFDDGNADIRYQIAGRAGAERLGMRGLGDAEAMERSGATQEEIWRETGWWRGADGKWRVEIGDIRLADDWKEKVKAGCQLRDIVAGPVLDAYDNAIGGVWVSVDQSLKGSGTAGVFNIRLGTIRIDPSGTRSKSGFLTTLAHEIQHTIQLEEGLERGTSLSYQMDVRERQVDMTAFPKAWWEYERRNKEFIPALSRFVESIAEPWLRYIHDASIDEKGRVKFPYETKDEFPRINGRMIRSLSDIAKGVEKKLNRWKFYDIGGLARNGDLADVLRRVGADELGWFLADAMKESYGEENTKWATYAQEAYAKMAAEAAAGIEEADAVVKEISRPLDEAFADARNAYNNAGGEVEARMVEARLGLTEEQRKEIPPWVTEAVVRQDTFAKQSDYSYAAQSATMARMTRGGTRYSIHFTLATGRGSTATYTDSQGVKRTLVVERGTRKQGMLKVAYKHCVDFGTASVGGFTLEELKRYERKILKEGKRVFDKDNRRLTFRWKSPDGVTFTIGIYIKGEGKKSREVVNTVYTDRGEEQTKKMLGTHLKRQASIGQPSRRRLPRPGAESKSESKGEKRAAVEGRVRAFDDVPKYSTRGTLAALATLSYIAGEEPDAANLEDVGKRLGGDVNVTEVLADAKAVHDGILGKLTRQENRIIAAVARKVGQAGKMKPGEVAKIVAEAVQAMHPEDLVREAYMRGAAAQDWAQGTRGAALNALVRQSRWDNYADMVTETGLDATGVLHRMILQKEATPAADGEGAGAGDGAAGEEKVPDGETGPQAREVYEAAEALTAEQEANLELALSEANAEMEERRADAEERERRAAEEEDDAGAADDEEDGGDVEEGDDSGLADEIKIPAEMLERHLVDVRDPATFACLLRKIIRNRILKANGAGADFADDLEAAHRAERELWANPTNVGMFAKSMAAILRDMAKRMLEHGSGAYTEIIRKAAVLPHYDDVDAIEKEVEFEVRVLARASIRQTSARIVNQARTTLKRYIGPTKRGEHPELEDDLTRKITGHVREMAKWYRRVLSMSEGQVERARDGWTDKDGGHHAGLEEILRERGRELDDAGMGGQAGLDADAVWSKAAWRLAALNRYGGTRYLLPMEARERCLEIETWMAKEALAWAEKTERLQARYAADRKTIIEGCAVVDRLTGQKRKWEEDTKADRLWRFTVNTINQRLRYLFSRAGGEKQVAAQELLQRYSLRLSQGTTRYLREKQEMRRDLVLAVRSVVGKRGVRKWLKRMLEEIPEAHAAALSKQGNRHLTFGQVMHLYGYLRQTATYGENIVKHGREWQRDYIERNVLTPEDLKILNLMMKIYADRRGELDEASRDLTGFPVKNPDPFYLPVQIKRKAQSGLETVVSTVQAMPSVFSERRNHGLDVDEKADVMVMFQDRMEKTARVLAFGRTGLDIIHTFGNGEVKDAITEARGPKFTTALIRHFTDWMNGGRPRLTNGEGADSKFLNSLRTIAVYQGLWGNTLTAFKQTLSAPVFSLAREIGERGIFQDMAGRFEEGWKQAKVELTQSEPWKARYGDVGIMQETQEAVLGAGEGTLWKALLRAGMEPLQKGDATPGILCQVTAYMVERDKLIEGGRDPEEAKRLAADKAMQQVEWTQQSSRAENLPEYSRRGDSGTRMLMMFASSPMLQAGWEMQRIIEWREKRDAFGKNSKEAADALKTLWNALIVNHVVMPILFQAATMIFNGILGRKEPDEDDLKELVFSMMIGPFARLAFIGGTMKAVYDAATGRGVYGRSDAAPSMLVNNSRNAVDLLATIPMDVFSGDMEAVWKDLDRFLKRNLAPYRHARKAWEAWVED